MPAADLFDWLDRRGVRAEIEVSRADVTRTFRVERGVMVGLSSNNPAEYLAQMLLNAGYLDEDGVKEMLELQAGSGMSLGKLLIVQRRVSETVLREVLETKLREGLFDCLAWPDGAFEVKPSDAPPALELDVRVPIRPALADGEHRASAWRAVREIIPHDDLRFRMTDPIWMEKVKPGSPSALLLGDVLRGLSVRGIILERHSLAFPVVQRLAELMQRGIIQIIGGANPTRRTLPSIPIPNAPAVTIKAKLEAGELRQALELARAASGAAPEDAELGKLRQDAERKLFAELSRALLTRYRVPKLLMGLDEIERVGLSDAERYLVGRIDGHWDLLSLMRVSPLREVEALLTFQELAEKGVISLG